MINPYDYTQQQQTTQPTLTIEVRLTRIENELKEIKQILNEIRWRV